LVVVTANWQIDQDQKCSNVKCRCPPAQPSSDQEKGSQKYQDPAKAPEDNTILSSSSSITKEATSPHQPAPQPQETPTDVSKQIADPADLGTSSAVSSEQIITILPQGKVLTIELLPMNLFHKL